jgi:hypothetical protein
VYARGDAVTVGVRRRALVPQIAIERIDIVKDGASSPWLRCGWRSHQLHTENFQGFEVQAQGDMRDTFSTDYRVSGIWVRRRKAPASSCRSNFDRNSTGNPTRSSTTISIDGAFRLAGWPGPLSIQEPYPHEPCLPGSGASHCRPLCARFTPSSQLHQQSGHAPGVSYPSCQQDCPLGASANADESRYQGSSRCTTSSIRQ